MLPRNVFHVLDLDETLVHSSFKPIPNADFQLNIELDNLVHRVYVRKRPGCDEFLQFTITFKKYIC